MTMNLRSNKSFKLSDVLIYSLSKVLENDNGKVKDKYIYLNNILNSIFNCFTNYDKNYPLTDELIEKMDSISIRFKQCFMDEILGSKYIFQSGKFDREFPKNEKPIGSGKSADVFKAESKVDKISYAYKRIDTTADQMHSNRSKEFIEVRNLAKLRNKNIVEYKSSWIEYNKSINDQTFEIQVKLNKNYTTVDLKQYEIYQFIQLELCETTLKGCIERLRQEIPFSDNYETYCQNPAIAYISTNLLREILNGLKYLHSKKIIHQDLHSENIFLTDGSNGSFIRIGDLAPGDELGENKDNKKTNIQQVGLLYAQMLGFGTSVLDSQSSNTKDFEEEVQYTKEQYKRIQNSNNTKNHLTILKQLLDGYFNKTVEISKFLMDSSWTISMDDIKCEPSIIEIVNSVEYPINNTINKISKNIIIRKFEQELYDNYKDKRLKHKQTENAENLGLNYNRIKNCRECAVKLTKSSDDIPIDDNEIESIVKYAFRACNSYEDISDLIMKFIQKNDKNNNENKWFAFVWKRKINSHYIDWQKTDSIFVSFEKEPNSKVYETLIIIFREKIRKITNSYKRNTFSDNELLSLTEGMHENIIKIIDNAKHNKKPIDEISKLINDHLANNYNKHDLICYFTKNELFMLMDNQLADNMLTFSHSDFQILITYSSTFKTKQLNITYDSDISESEQEIFKLNFFNNKNFIENISTVSLCSIKFNSDKYKCLVLYNSNISERNLKGVFDKFYNLKDLKARKGRSQSVTSLTDSIATTSRVRHCSNQSSNSNFDTQSITIDHYESDVSFVSSQSNLSEVKVTNNKSRIKLIWIMNTKNCDKTPVKRNNNTPTKITDFGISNSPFKRPKLDHNNKL